MTANEEPQAITPAAPEVSAEPAGRKRRRSRKYRVVVALAATLAVLLGGGLLVTTYYVDSVDALQPESFQSAGVTTIMAADGKTQLAQLGTVNRIAVPMTVIPDKVRGALIAGEDRDFFKDSFRGSELTHRYVRLATQMTGNSYRETVLARKLEDQYDRLTIMGFYLNSVDFGRGAVGVEAAAQAYFGKPAKDLTVAEAAVLGSVLHEPYAADGGLSPFDPEAHPAEAKDRWAYVLDNLVGRWITPDERSQQAFPSVRAYATVTPTAEWGIVVKPGENAGRATGHVVNQVYEELRQQGIEPTDLRNGGYRVYTTIDPRAQLLLEQAARPDLKDSELYGTKVVRDANGKVQQDLEAAGVVLDHATGAVLAYYGGLDGNGPDLAGLNTVDNALVGGHPAGGTMKAYTLAAALEAGASLDSHWRSLPYTDPTDKIRVGNNGASSAPCKEYCTLTESFVKSYNVPFYWVARQLGPGAIVKTAYQAGIRCMWDADGKEQLARASVQSPNSRFPFDRPVGYGQYAVTVLDNAAGIGTIANGGVYNKPYFVQKVEKRDPVTGSYLPIAGVGAKQAPKQVMRPAVAGDVTYAMTQVAADRRWTAAVDGREIATVGGTWEGSVLRDGKLQPTPENAHAWVVGFTKQVTVAIWTGNAAGSAPVVDPLTKATITAGTAPFRIWSGVVADYSTGMPKEKLAGPSHVGRIDFPLANGVSPTPSP
ncbi:MAG: penicillin-binding protein [Hamadaea sp.]|uniref:transglycosylase domain-containing protein n=1 Tax=Hamadaea sp. TaxID=2024425 RepID=UPI001804264E|nr:transglycosylase domain-containing protein [Hamadaea sp.]NUR71725.1 penicillin-binding protein [Hamadaea sp.]NUT19039.1 penicillin-binding protein [Hamadaea sp.]